MVRVEQLKNGHGKSTSIANFTARIVTDIIRDDGEEESRDFGVEADLCGRKLVFAVRASEFSRMGWVLQKLGPQAVIYPGQQQHARAAIQMLSGTIRQERVFAHLGWRKHGPHRVYLHAPVAIGADVPVSGLQVHLPADLRHYQLRRPEDAESLVRVVRASLRILSVAGADDGDQ